MDVFEIYGEVGGWVMLCFFMIALPAIINFLLLTTVTCTIAYSEAESNFTIRDMFRRSWDLFPFTDPSDVMFVFFFPLINYVFTAAIIISILCIGIYALYCVLDDRFDISYYFRKIKLPKLRMRKHIARLWNKFMDVKIK